MGEPLLEDPFAGLRLLLAVRLAEASSLRFLLADAAVGTPFVSPCCWSFNARFRVVLDAVGPGELPSLLLSLSSSSSSSSITITSSGTPFL